MYQMDRCYYCGVTNIERTLHVIVLIYDPCAEWMEQIIQVYAKFLVYFQIILY